MDFNEKDVKRVAESLLEWHIDWEVSRGMNAYNECKHCNGRVYWNKDITNLKHDTNCVVLIAKDLLTGLE
jgi:hypothetical protein